MGSQQGKLLESAQIFEAGEHFALRETKLGKKELAEGVHGLLTTLPGLVSLEVISCKLKTWPSEISDLHQLTSLKLPHNIVSNFPSTFPPLLMELDLCDNKLDEFPIKDGNPFPNLAVLNLSQNSLSSFPSSIPFPHLESLDLSSNSFASIPDSIISLTTLTSLNVSKNKLKDVPPSISSLSSLSRLSLSENTLGAFSPQILALEGLKYLALASNKIKEIPKGICGLKELEVLELQHNHISTIPIEFFELRELGTLKLYDNDLTAIPGEIGALNKLTELFLQENSLVRLPKSIGSLSLLRKLFIEYNQLVTLPDSMKFLMKLVVLMVHNNRFDSIPPVLFNMRSLLRFSLDHNPMEYENSETRAKLKDPTTALAVISAPPTKSNAIDCASVRVKSKDFVLSSSPTRRTRRASVVDTRSDRLSPRLSLPTTSLAPPSSPSRSFHRPSISGHLFDSNSAKDTTTASPSNSPSNSPSSGLHSSSPSSSFPSSPGNNFLGPSSLAPPLASSSLSSHSSSPSTPLSASSSLCESPSQPRSPFMKMAFTVREKESEVPHYSKFKDAFNAFVEQQDFSQNRKKNLEKMSVQEKWNMLSTYKGSSVDLLRTKPAKGEKQENPADFIRTFASRIPTVLELTRLQECIRRSSELGKSSFVDSGGLVALTSLLVGLKKSVIRVRNKEAVANETLKIFLFLAQMNPKWIITTTDAVKAIVLCLDLGDGGGGAGIGGWGEWEGGVTENVLAILELVCGVAFIGPSLVLEALTVLATSPNPSPTLSSTGVPAASFSCSSPSRSGSMMRGKKKGKRNLTMGGSEIVKKGVSTQEKVKDRLVPLVQILAGDESPECKCSALKIINSILDSVSDLEERFLLRLELGPQGTLNALLAALPDDPPSCAFERNHFEAEKMQDYQDMFDKFPKEYVNNIVIENGGGVEEGGVGGGGLQVVVWGIEGEEGGRGMWVEEVEGENWGYYRDNICKKLSIRDAKKFSLFSLEENSKKNPTQFIIPPPLSSLTPLPLSSPASHLPHILLRPSPVTLTIYHFNEKKGEKEGGEGGEAKWGEAKDIVVDPMLTVEEVVMEVLEKFGEEAAWENCGLYFSKDGSGPPNLRGPESAGLWLPSQEILFDNDEVMNLIYPLPSRPRPSSPSLSASSPCRSRSPSPTRSSSPGPSLEAPPLPPIPPLRSPRSLRKIYFSTQRFSFSVQFPNGNIRTFDNVSSTTKGGALLKFLLKEYGKENTEGYGLTLESPSNSSSISLVVGGVQKASSSINISSSAPPSCKWVGEEEVIEGLLPMDNPLLHVSVRPLSMVVYLPEVGSEEGEKKGKGKKEMLDVEVSAPLADLLSSLSSLKVLPSPPTHYTLSCLLEKEGEEGEGERVQVMLDRPLRPQLSEKNLSVKDVAIVIEEGSGPVSAADFSLTDRSLAEGLEIMVPSPMYPEQEDIPGTNITFNEPKDKGEGEGEGEGEGGGEIESATVNKIIQILTSKRAIEHNFQTVFLFTYKYFSSDEFLLQKLKERFYVPKEGEAEGGLSEGEVEFIQTRVVVFLKQWFTQGISDETVKDKIRDFIKNDMEKILPEKNLHLCATLNRLLDEESADEQNYAQFGNAPKSKIPKMPPSGKLTFFDISPVEVARQLTLMTFEYYHKLERTEFFHQNWASDSRRHRAPNLMKIISFFNGVSKFVAYSLLVLEKVRDRGKLYGRFVEIAQHLKAFNNFHLLAAFVSGLGHCGLSRLKHTLARVSKSDHGKLRELESLMSMESSYRTYRTYLVQADLPAIPYIGVYLTDLTFIEDGNRDILGQNRINMAKYRFIYNTLYGLERYQTVRYCLNRVEVVEHFLEDLLEQMEGVSEDALYQMSLQREPRGCQRGDIV